MKKTELAVRRTDSILDEVSEHFDMIRHRAFELFRNRGDSWAGELDDWLNAERLVSSEPAIKLRRANGSFEIDANLPGVDPRNLDVQVTAEDVLIKARREEAPPAKAEAGAAGGPDGSSLQFFGSVHLPALINPDGVKADYRAGVLHLTAPIVEPVMKKIEVRA
jgi:HSP20 family protein